MFDEKEKRSRGPIPLSKVEYESICDDENKKYLDQLELESKYNDENYTNSSKQIIPDNGVNDKGDYDFETEEKPKELSPMQKSRLSRLVELVDDEEYQAELVDILSQYLQDKGLGILTTSYNVYKNGKFIKKIEDKLFFDENNSSSFNFNEKKLSLILDKYGVELTDSDYEDVNSIARAIKHLIGTWVVLIQKTRGEYKNYKILSVLDDSEVK